MSTQTVTPKDTQPLLSPAEAARLTNVSTKTIRREIDRGARCWVWQQFADEMLSLLTLSDEQAAANTEQPVQIASFEG